MEKKKEALECYNKAISLDPNHERAHFKKNAILKEMAKE